MIWNAHGWLYVFCQMIADDPVWPYRYWKPL